MSEMIHFTSDQLLLKDIRAVGLIRITNSNSNIRITRKEAK